MALTEKQRKFVAAYAGNGAEACRLAGYKGNATTLSSQARANLRLPLIANAIALRRAREASPLIASRQDRQKFWTTMMQDAESDPSSRLRASELLGKSEADFVDKVQHSGVVSIAVVDPYATKPKERLE